MFSYFRKAWQLSYPRWYQQIPRILCQVRIWMYDQGSWSTKIQCKSRLWQESKFLYILKWKITMNYNCKNDNLIYFNTLRFAITSRSLTYCTQQRLFNIMLLNLHKSIQLLNNTLYCFLDVRGLSMPQNHDDDAKNKIGIVLSRDNSHRLG